jgi:MFS family permease
MPKVVGAIGGLDLYPWAFSAFMLASTVATPFFGRFADMFGVRRMMFVSIALFLAGSTACGFAGTMLQLVVFRALQGVGAGGILILTFVAFGVLFTPEQRGRAQSLFSLVWGVSSLVGPLTGGLMVSHFPWPWIFWINLPVGAIATALIAVGMPRHESAHRAHKMDWTGGALLVVGLLALMLAMTTPQWPFPLGWGIGPVALVAFWWHERRCPEPLVPFAPFKSRLFSASAVVGFLSCLTMFAALTYVPLYVQGALGKSAPEAGVALTPMMVAWPIAGATAGWLLNRAGFRTLVVAGAALMLAGFALLSWPGFKADALWVGLESALLGLGMGCITSTTMVGVSVSVPRAQLGASSSALALARNIGGALGVSMLGGLQLAVMNDRLKSAAAGLPPAQLQALGNPQSMLQGGEALHLPESVWVAFRSAIAHSLDTVFAVSLGVAILCLIAAFFMPAQTPKAAAASVTG